MNIAETLRSLLRRWYLVVPGLLLAGALSFGAWTYQDPEYERSATQMLLPGASTVPEGGNPYIYIGGLTQAADVVVRALGARNVVEDVVGDRSGVDVQVARDPSASGPLILVTVTAGSDADAKAVLTALVSRTDDVLDSLQDQEGISEDSRIKVIPVAIDESSIVIQRNRLIIAAGAGIVGAMLTLVITVAIDGLLVARGRRTRRADHPATPTPTPETADFDDDPTVPEPMRHVPDDDASTLVESGDPRASAADVTGAGDDAPRPEPADDEDALEPEGRDSDAREPIPAGIHRGGASNGPVTARRGRWAPRRSPNG